MTTFFTNSLWAVIASNAANKPDEVVLRDSNKRACSYASFVDGVNSYALFLMKAGVRQGDRVLFLEKPSIRAIKIFFAIYRLGAVAVIVDPAMGRSNFSSRVEFSECKFVVLDPVLSIIERIPMATSLIRKIHPGIPDLRIKLPQIIVLPNHAEKIDGDFHEQSQQDSDDALIIFTSGTTSVPKGVVHTFGSLFATLNLIKSEINTDKSDVFLSSQLHFLIIALISGATGIIDTGIKFNAKRFLSLVRDIKPTHVFLLPAEGQKIVDEFGYEGEKIPTSLKCVMFGSAPVLTGFLEKFTKIISSNTKVLCIYGSTEILPISVTTAEEKIAFGTRGDYLGRPLSGTKVQIENEEFLVSGKNLCARYLNEGGSMLYFSSGDLGFVTNEGALVLTGRKKDMIIKNHHNVYPSLFEPTICKIKGVKNCALVGVYDENEQDEKIHLCITKDNISMSDDAFIKHVENALRSGEFSIDSYALPDNIHIMELPLSGRSQKINKQKIREILTESV